MNKKLSFQSDYIAGAHPDVLKALCENNLEATSGYGTDRFCLSAEEKIKKACNCPEAKVYFLVGGTQANAVVISSVLKKYEGVISAKTGHIHAHEAGAVEHTGHKVLELPQTLGKISADDLSDLLKTFYADENCEHMVFPGMVYISHPTEYGTLYSKKELTDISGICREYNIPLFLDGARLGYGLMSYQTDVTLKDIAELCDVFYIGGTKMGALCGEAVVFTKNNTPAHFVNLIKKNGALLAKGRLLGIQFDTLFTDDLYWKISKHAIEKASELKAVLASKNCKFAWETPTNQQFVILDNELMNELKEKVAFSFWEKYDDTHTVVRFATSWSTTKEDIEYLDSIWKD